MSKRKRVSDLKWEELAHADDFITHNLLDNLHYWIKSRKLHDRAEPTPTIGPKVEELLKRYVIDRKTPSVKKLTDILLCHPQTHAFLLRFGGESQIKGFKRLLTRYIEAYQPACGFEFGVTDRYFQKLNNLESCVTARVKFEAGQEIRYLTGSLAVLTEEEEAHLRTQLSVINVSSLGPCVMLGPCRFINHNCDPNCRIARGDDIKIFAIKEILPGEELTVSYSPSYFGKNNRHCLCATCERNGLGGYDHENVEETQRDSGPIDETDDEFAPEIETIVIPTDSEEDGSEDTHSPSPMCPSDDSDVEQPMATQRSQAPKLDATSQRQARSGTRKELDRLSLSLVAAALEPETKGKEVGGRNLRARDKRRIRPVNSEDVTLLHIYKRDKSLDSLALSTNPADADVLKARANMRTLHKLYMGGMYHESANFSTIYDCLNCGVYFQFGKLHPYKEYCQACVRHQHIYRLAWPDTAPMDDSTSLDLRIGVDRASVGELMRIYGDRATVNGTSDVRGVSRATRRGGFTSSVLDEFTSDEDEGTAPDIRKKQGSSDSDMSSDGTPYLSTSSHEEASPTRSHRLRRVVPSRTSPRQHLPPPRERTQRLLSSPGFPLREVRRRVTSSLIPSSPAQTRRSPRTLKVRPLTPRLAISGSRGSTQTRQRDHGRGTSDGSHKFSNMDMAMEKLISFAESSTVLLRRSDDNMYSNDPNDPLEVDDTSDDDKDDDEDDDADDVVLEKQELMDEHDCGSDATSTPIEELSRKSTSDVFSTPTKLEPPENATPESPSSFEEMKPSLMQPEDAEKEEVLGKKEFLVPVLVDRSSLDRNCIPPSLVTSTVRSYKTESSNIQLTVQGYSKESGPDELSSRKRRDKSLRPTSTDTNSSKPVEVYNADSHLLPSKGVSVTTDVIRNFENSPVGPKSPTEKIRRSFPPPVRKTKVTYTQTYEVEEPIMVTTDTLRTESVSQRLDDSVEIADVGIDAIDDDSDEIAIIEPESIGESRYNRQPTGKRKLSFPSSLPKDCGIKKAFRSQGVVATSKAVSKYIGVTPSEPNVILSEDKIEIEPQTHEVIEIDSD